MYRRCLICRANFPESGVLRHLPCGDRVAYDPSRGRLWVVCRSCRRWSLTPLESRWEVREELEALLAGKARLLSRTENIGLYRVGKLEIVRVGPSGREEEVWWRYGRQLPPPPRWARWTPPFLRHLRFGTLAWVGERACAACGHAIRELLLQEWKILVARPGPDDRHSFTLTRRCPRCRDAQDGGLRLTGLEAEMALARIMAFRNRSGETRVTVQAATRLLGDPEGPEALFRLLSRHGRPLGELQPIGLTALEVLVNEARDRTVMRLEAEALQARWRREEELAALFDGELSPVARLEELIRGIRSG